MDPFWFSVAAVVAVSLLSFVGVFALSLGENRIRKFLLYLVSFAAGALFGDALLHLLPEAFLSDNSGVTVPLSVLAGILAFFVLEKVIHWHHCHTMEECEHTKALGITNLIGDGVHNLVDGVVIAGSFLVSVPLGITTTIAVALHEIPQEISDFGVLLHAGYSVKRALFYNFLSALGAVAGVLLVFGVHGIEGSIDLYLVPFTAGGFIYIAGSDLIPELKKESRLSRTLLQFVFLALGMLVMLALRFLE